LFGTGAIYTTGTTQTFTCDYDGLTSTQTFVRDDASHLLALGPATAAWVGNPNTGQNVSVATTTVLHLAGSPANCNNPALSYYMKLSASTWGI
jgi:hypothetical protein